MVPATVLVLLYKIGGKEGGVSARLGSSQAWPSQARLNVNTVSCRCCNSSGYGGSTGQTAETCHSSIGRKRDVFEDSININTMQPVYSFRKSRHSIKKKLAINHFISKFNAQIWQ